MKYVLFALAVFAVVPAIAQTPACTADQVAALQKQNAQLLAQNQAFAKQNQYLRNQIDPAKLHGMPAPPAAAVKK